MKKLLSTILIGLLFVGVKISAQTRPFSLTEMDLSLSYQQYGSPVKNHSVIGEELSIAGEKFTEGIGVQANNKMKLRLSRKAERFTCKIGINDRLLDYVITEITQIPLTDGTMLFYRTENDKKQFSGVGFGDGSLSTGTVVYSILADGREIYNSGIIRLGEKARNVDLDIRRISILELIVEDAGDGASGDHANWIEPVITYSEIKPSLVNPDYQTESETMPNEIRNKLEKKIKTIHSVQLPLERTKTDWLLDNSTYKSNVYQTHGGKDLILTNGLVSRIFRIYPNLATIDILNHMTGENMLRAVSNEGVLKIDDKTYTLGGLNGQQEFGYTQYKWIDSLQIIPNSFRITDFTVSDLKPRMKWANKRWSLVKSWDVSGKVLTFYLEGPEYMKGVKVKLNYALYDGMPCISKWMEIENHTGIQFTLDEFITSARFLDLIEDFDRLLGARSTFLLGKWIKDARQWGTTEEEKDLYEWNARTLVTVWGPKWTTAHLFEYSNRQWSGLMKGYYKVRWEKFISYLKAQPKGEWRYDETYIKTQHGRPAQDASDFYTRLTNWEYDWAFQKNEYPSVPSGDEIEIVRELYNKWKPVMISTKESVK